ncbi:hypothetical protein FRC91_13055 [Bradymonadales bacterium TMQ1]|nr:hypothetical protein FRC91_13055 [Bradymonadales bacterium TMQ1]
MGHQDKVIDRLVDDGKVESELRDTLRATFKTHASSALLTRAALDEDDLLEALSLAFDLPPAGYADGLFIERELLSTLGPEAIRHYQVLPVRRRAGERVDVLVVEPLNAMARQILEEALGLPLRQYIWPQLRYLQARHFFVGDELPDFATAYLREHPVTMGYATAGEQPELYERLKSSASLQVNTWEEAERRAFFEHCFDRDTLLKALLGLAAGRLTRRLIVVLGKSGVQPYFQEDWTALDQNFERVDALRERKATTTLDLARQDREALITGNAAELGLAPLFEALEVEAPPLLAMIPVRIGGRAAMALLGAPTDPRAAVRLDEVSETFALDELVDAAALVGRQLEELIRRAKAGTLPPPAERIPPLPVPRHQLGLGFEDSLIETTIASRQRGRHRWEIIDISHASEEPSEAAEFPDIRSQVPEPEIIGAISEAFGISEASEPRADITPSEPSQPADTSESSEVSELSKTSDASDVSDASEISDASDVSEVSEVSDASEATELSDPADTPMLDIAAALSDSYEAPLTDELVELPLFPDPSEVSEAPKDPLEITADFSPAAFSGELSSEAGEAPRHFGVVSSAADEDDEGSMGASHTEIYSPSSIALESADDTPAPASAVGATSFGMPALFADDTPAPASAVGATSFGMPALSADEFSSQASDPALSSARSSSISEVMVADADERQARHEGEDEGVDDVDKGWSDILNVVSESAVAPMLAEKERKASEPQAALLTPVDEEPVNAEPADKKSLDGKLADAPAPLDEAEERDAIQPAPLATTAELHPIKGAPIEAPASDSENSHTGRGIRSATLGLNIPTDASGVPRAQIFRRPRRRDRQDDAPHAPPHEEPEFTELGASATGHTFMGVGEVRYVQVSANAISEISEPVREEPSEPRADRWLDELEQGPRSESNAETGGSSSRATMQINPTRRTRGFGELMEHMESDAPSTPRSVPFEALEEILDSGPVAVDLSESLEMLDARDHDLAFAAAEHVATAGADTGVIASLEGLFPGRIFIDRYQYTARTLPPVREHGPVLDALVRMGRPSLNVVRRFIDNPSLELRFYATFLLTELPAEGLLHELLGRLFDRDQQTRQLARSILKGYRDHGDFEALVLAPLRHELSQKNEEFRVEQAAENIRQLRDLKAIPGLVDALAEYGGRVQLTIHRALREITLQPLGPSPSEWRRWWFDAHETPRWRWLVDAMNSPDDELRLLAFDEIEQLPGLELNYHPDQPPKLRIRAQSELAEWFVRGGRS